MWSQTDQAWQIFMINNIEEEEITEKIMEKSISFKQIKIIGSDSII